MPQCQAKGGGDLVLTGCRQLDRLHHLIDYNELKADTHCMIRCKLLITCLELINLINKCIQKQQYRSQGFIKSGGPRSMGWHSTPLW